MSESQQHAAKMNWKDAFALSMCVSGGIYISFGATYAALGAVGSLLVWAFSAFVGWVQNNLFAEMGAMYPEDAGGIPVYSIKALQPFLPSIGAFASFCYWFGWSAVISINSVTSGNIIISQWFPDNTFSLTLGAIVLSTGQLIGIALMLLLMVMNLFGAHAAARLNKYAGVVLLASFVVLIFAPFYADNWHWSNLIEDAQQHLDLRSWASWHIIFAWLFMLSWASYGTEMCAAFMPEYRSIADGRKALFSSGLYTLFIFITIPLSVGGLVAPGDKSDPLQILFTVLHQLMTNDLWASSISLFIIAAVMMGVNAAMAEGAQVLYGTSKLGFLPALFHRTNSRGVPAYALFTAVALNIAMCVFISNPISIMFSANIGYIIAIIIGLISFIVLRKTRSDLHRPFRAVRGAIGLAVILIIYNAFILVVGITSSDITGYGGTHELIASIAILGTSFVLYLFGRRNQRAKARIASRQPILPLEK